MDKKMSREEASEIVKNAFGRRPDFPSGKEYVDEVRGHDIDMDDQEKIAEYIKAETKGGHLQDWSEVGVLMTKEQKEDYFNALGQHILEIVKELGYRKPVDRPELREEIAGKIAGFLGLDWEDIIEADELLCLKYAGQIQALHNKGEPPLVKLAKHEDPSLYTFAEGTQAQRESDIKHYA